MRKYNNILELRDHAIYLYPGIEAYIPDENRREELPLEGIRDLYDHNYSRKDGIICFVYQRRIFAIPESWNIIEVLLKEGFNEAKFYIPFTNGEYPAGYWAEWNMLKKEQVECREEDLKIYNNRGYPLCYKEERRKRFEEKMLQKIYKEKGQCSEEDFKNKCHKYCEQNGYGEISDYILQQAVEIPESGMMVRMPNGYSVEFPIIRNNLFNNNTTENLGTFNRRKGICIFLYCDGKTYISKSRKVVKALKKAGYRKENGLYIPLTKKSVILDQDLRKIWE